MHPSRPRFWFELLALMIAIACAMALFLACLGAGASAAAGVASAAPAAQAQPSPDAPQAYDGIITDTHCLAKHSAKVGLSAADCTRVCVHAGEHFALVDGDKAYTLEGDPEDLKRLAGERATVKGTLNGTTISVTSVTAAPTKAD